MVEIQNPKYNIQNPTIALLFAGKLHIGGVEEHLLSLLRADSASLFHWLVCAPMSEEFAARVRDAGGEPISWITRGQFAVGSLLCLLRLLREHQVVLAHAHDARASYLGGIAARLCRLPMVNTVHFPAYFYEKVKHSPSRVILYQILDRFVNRWLVDRTLYVSTRCYQDALSRNIVSAEKAAVIPNGVPLLRFLASGPDIFPELPHPRFCFIGRLVAEKAVDILIRAVGILAKETRAFHLLLAGDGPLGEEILQRIREENVAALVSILGFRTDVPEILRSCDVFVLPSRHEGMPIGLLEALAAGVPCIVTDVGENALVVRDGREGLVIPADDAPALARAMAAMLADPARRQTMAEAARARGQEFDEKRTGERVVAIYEELLKNREK